MRPTSGSAVAAACGPAASETQRRHHRPSAHAGAHDHAAKVEPWHGAGVCRCWTSGARGSCELLRAVCSSADDRARRAARVLARFLSIPFASPKLRSLGAMHADHPGSYLHLSQPMRLDARPCTYMGRESHDALPGQAAKVVQPSKSEWTRRRRRAARVLRDERATARLDATGALHRRVAAPIVGERAVRLLSGSPRLMAEATSRARTSRSRSRRALHATSRTASCSTSSTVSAAASRTARPSSTPDRRGARKSRAAAARLAPPLRRQPLRRLDDLSAFDPDHVDHEEVTSRASPPSLSMSHAYSVTQYSTCLRSSPVQSRAAPGDVMPGRSERRRRASGRAPSTAAPAARRRRRRQRVRRAHLAHGARRLRARDRRQRRRRWRQRRRRVAAKAPPAAPTS